MDFRISVREETLRKVYEGLKERGYSLSQISEEIGSDFRNHLYKQTSFSESSFRKLESLYEGSISSTKMWYIDGRGEVEKLVLEKDERLAEFVGMILGDGHIDSHSYDRGDRYVSSHYLSITLSSKEEKIIQRAKFLAESCLNRSFNEEEIGHSEAVNLKIHGKEVIHALKEIGLMSGNKVENQVSVPSWIMRDKELQKRCLRGLFDTDGSYYERSEDGYKVVYFKNRSKELLDDFVDLCNSLNIRTSSAGEYAVQVAAQIEVEKFVDKVSPVKAATFGS